MTRPLWFGVAMFAAFGSIYAGLFGLRWVQYPLIGLALLAVVLALWHLLTAATGAVPANATGSTARNKRAQRQTALRHLVAASPDLQAEILGRISTGDWTVDHERVSRAGETREVLVAYQVADGQIARVLMLG